MKKTTVVLIILLLMPSMIAAIEQAPRISDREIVERLTRLEEGQKAILREMDKQFESVDKRFESIDRRFESIDKRFGSIDSQFNRLSAIFTALVIAIIGFAIWDRRTMIRPFETRIKEIGDDIAENRGKLHSLIDALRTLSKTDEKVAEVLKKFNLL